MQNGIDNKLYKFLEIENWEAASDEAYLYYTSLQSFPKVNGFTRVIDHRDFLNKVKSFSLIFQNLNLNCTYAAFIVMNRETMQFLHHDKGNQKARLLWPVRNCLGTKVSFYSTDKNQLKNISANDKSWNYYDIKDAKKIDEYELVKPLIVNLSIPHYVEVDPHLTEERINLYFMFTPDPVYLFN